MPVKVKVEGLEGVEQALLELLPRKARAAMRSSLDAAGTFMAVQIALKAPSRTGFLARHIVKEIKLSTREDEGSVNVGPSKEAYYAQFVEFGSIHNRPKQPFIQPAFEANKETMVDFFAAKMREALEL